MNSAVSRCAQPAAGVTRGASALLGSSPRSLLGRSCHRRKFARGFEAAVRRLACFLFVPVPPSSLSGCVCTSACVDSPLVIRYLPIELLNCFFCLFVFSSSSLWWPKAVFLSDWQTKQRHTTAWLRLAALQESNTNTQQHKGMFLTLLDLPCQHVDLAIRQKSRQQEEKKVSQCHNVLSCIIRLHYSAAGWIWSLCSEWRLFHTWTLDSIRTGREEN